MPPALMQAPRSDLGQGQQPASEGHLLADMTLTPAIATVIFVLSCLAGVQYRRVWKAEGPRWQLWLFGCATAMGLIVLGFVPLDIQG